MFHTQGFFLEGANGQPRMAYINPSYAANALLVPGDVLLEVNGKSVRNDTQAAKVIAAIVGDVVLKVLAKKPRDHMPAVKAMDAAAGVDAGMDAATKVQSLINGKNVSRARKPPPGYPPTEQAAITVDAERAAAAAKAQSLPRGEHSRRSSDSARNPPPADTTDAERAAAAAKAQSLPRRRHSRRSSDSARNPPPADTTDAERAAAAAKAQSLPRRRHSQKQVDSAPNPPAAEQEETGTEEFTESAQESSPKHGRLRRSKNAFLEHRHRHSTDPDDVGAESSLAESSPSKPAATAARARRRSSAER